MPYTLDHWKARVATRSDLTVYVAHFTRPGKIDGKQASALDILLKMLREQLIQGSDSASGFICGNRKAVCFQDAPLNALAQNIYIEQEYRKTVTSAKLRYSGIGLLFPKPYVFAKGGRPVIYDDTTTAKAFLPEDQWWRIVRFDLSDSDCVYDWTHEREWRVPDSFSFSRTEPLIVVPNHNIYRRLIEKAAEIHEFDLLKSVKGIVHLGAILH